MISPTRRTILAYLAGTFVLGAVAGGALGYGWGRRPVFRPFDREVMRARFCDHLVNDLNLSPAQREKLDPILRQNMDEFESVHREHFGQIGELMKRQRERISAILDPEQKAKFDAMEREREQRMSKRRGSENFTKPSGENSPQSEKPHK